MVRTLTVLHLLLAAIGCEKAPSPPPQATPTVPATTMARQNEGQKPTTDKNQPSGALATIEDGEAFVAAKEIALTGKKEYTGQNIAARAFHYKADSKVAMNIYQFRSPEAAKLWQEMVGKVPLGNALVVVRDAVAFAILEGPDADRQRLLKLLTTSP